MMTFQINWMPGEKIVLGTMHQDYHVMRDTEAASKRLIELLDTSDEPVPYLLDLSEIKMGFSDMVLAMGMLTGGTLASFMHPMLRQVVIVTQDGMLKFGATALGQAQYGGRKAQVVATVQ